MVWIQLWRPQQNTTYDAFFALLLTRPSIAINPRRSYYRGNGAIIWGSLVRNMQTYLTSGLESVAKCTICCSQSHCLITVTCCGKAVSKIELVSIAKKNIKESTPQETDLSIVPKYSYSCWSYNATEFYMVQVKAACNLNSQNLGFCLDFIFGYKPYKPSKISLQFYSFIHFDHLRGVCRAESSPSSFMMLISPN